MLGVAGAGANPMMLFVLLILSPSSQGSSCRQILERVAKQWCRHDRNSGGGWCYPGVGGGGKFQSVGSLIAYNATLLPMEKLSMRIILYLVRHQLRSSVGILLLRLLSLLSLFCVLLYIFAADGGWWCDVILPLISSTPLRGNIATWSHEVFIQVPLCGLRLQAITTLINDYL
jgi:hypothetical protein